MQHAGGELLFLFGLRDPGRGTRFIPKDGKAFRSCPSKCREEPDEEARSSGGQADRRVPSSSPAGEALLVESSFKRVELNV